MTQLLNGAKLFGLPVVVSRNLYEWVQVRFPRTKKKRIRKKWAKDESRNYRMVQVQTYRICDGVIYMHPWFFDKLSAQCIGQFQSPY